MPNITADEILTVRHHRNHIQFGGPRPNNPITYGGQDAQYMIIEGVTLPELGGINPIYVHDPRKQGSYRLVGRSLTAPALPKATLKLHERHGSIPRQLTRIGCKFNMYEAAGACGDLSDLVSGWSDYVLIYSGALVTDKNLGNRSTWDSDEALEDDLSLELSDIYPVGALGFGEGASAQVDREVTSLVYGSKASCGDCGPQDDGSKRIYAVTRSSGAGSPGLPGELIYTLDGGGSWNQTNITGLGAAEDPLDVDIAGSYLIIVGTDAYYYSLLDSTTGVPGTFTKVTAGFVALKSPTSVFIGSPREIYFSGKGGYVYKSTNITAGVSVVSDGSATAQDLNYVEGLDNTILAVGLNGAMIKSSNRGVTWGATATSPAGNLTNLNAVFVMDSLRYWVGSSFGRLYYTLDGGNSWNEVAFSGSGSGAIYDIDFPTDEVGYFVHNTPTPRARLFTTFDGGVNWTQSSPRILNMPTANKFGHIAYPRDVDSAVAVNNIALAGLAGNGVDGIILVGSAAKL